MVTQLVPLQRVEIDQVLESAVILSWKELLKNPDRSVIHVEYGTAPEPSLQYIKAWVSTRRGAWSLICEYWTASGSKSVPARGLTFSNGYHSSLLAEILDVMMREREGFTDSLGGQSGVSLILVHAPAGDERQKAADCMSEAYQRLGLDYTRAAGSGG